MLDDLILLDQERLKIVSFEIPDAFCRLMHCLMVKGAGAGGMRSEPC